jgi:hypothetical protein
MPDHLNTHVLNTLLYVMQHITAEGGMLMSAKMANLYDLVSMCALGLHRPDITSLDSLFHKDSGTVFVFLCSPRAHIEHLSGMSLYDVHVLQACSSPKSSSLLPVSRLMY